MKVNETDIKYSTRHHVSMKEMTKRREVYFEYESVTDKPSKGNSL